MSNIAAATAAPNFGVVINHYAGRDASEHLAASAVLAASLTVRQREVADVLVLDGSAAADDRLREEVERIGARYHHDGRRLSFAEAYNLGAALIRTDWLVLSASDVYPSLDFYASAARFIAGAHPDRIGCIIPRLSRSDLPVQESQWARGRIVRTPLMTLNLNIFQRTVFEAIGGVPECYSGAFNDVEMAIKLGEMGRGIYMLPDRCTHYGSLTLATGDSAYRYVKDQEVFASRHPHMARHGEFWDLDLSQLYSGLPRAYLRLSRLLGRRSRRLDRVNKALKVLPALDRFNRAALT